MIDEKRLEELRVHTEIGVEAWKWVPLIKDDAEDLIRLARLGLWAEKYRETIRTALKISYDEYQEAEDLVALEALPKEKA